MSDTGTPGGHDDEIGSLAEETTKLLGAFAGWARDHAGDVGDAASGLAGQLGDLAAGIDDHVATGAPECTWCPVCRTVHVVRTLSPEVKTHLAVAAGSLAQAVAALMAPPSSEETHSRATRTETTQGADESVEHIDLDDDWSQ